MSGDVVEEEVDSEDVEGKVVDETVECVVALLKVDWRCVWASISSRLTLRLW